MSKEQLTEKKLLKALKDNKSYKETQQFLNAVTHKDDKMVEVFSTVILQSFKSPKCPLMTKLLALRLFKDTFIIGNMAFIDDLDPQIEEAIITAAAYNPKFRAKGKDEKETRGGNYFIQTQKRPKDNQTTQLGNSFVLLATELVKYFAKWHPANPDGSSSRFLEAYEELQAMGVQFNTQIYFTKQEESAFHKNYQLWLTNIQGDKKQQNHPSQKKVQIKNKIIQQNTDEVKPHLNNHKQSPTELPKAKVIENKGIIKQSKIIIQTSKIQQKNNVQKQNQEFKDKIQELTKKWEQEIKKSEKYYQQINDKQKQLEEVRVHVKEMAEQLLKTEDSCKKKCIVLENQVKINKQKVMEVENKLQQKQEMIKKYEEKTHIGGTEQDRIIENLQKQRDLSIQDKIGAIRKYEQANREKEQISGKLKNVQQRLSVLQKQKNGLLKQLEFCRLNNDKGVIVGKEPQNYKVEQINKLEAAMNDLYKQVEAYRIQNTTLKEDKRSLNEKIKNLQEHSKLKQNIRQENLIQKSQIERKRQNVGSQFLVTQQHAIYKPVAPSVKQTMSLSAYLGLRAPQDITNKQSMQTNQNSLHNTFSVNNLHSTHLNMGRSKQSQMKTENSKAKLKKKMSQTIYQTENVVFSKTQNAFAHKNLYARSKNLVQSVFPFVDEYFSPIKTAQSQHFRACCFLGNSRCQPFFEDEIISVKINQSKDLQNHSLIIFNKTQRHTDVKIHSQNLDIRVKGNPYKNLAPLGEQTFILEGEVTNVNFRFPIVSIIVSGLPHETIYRIPIPITLFSFTKFAESEFSVKKWDTLILDMQAIRHRSQKFILNQRRNNLALLFPNFVLDKISGGAMECTSIVSYRYIPEIKLKLKLVQQGQHCEIETEFVKNSKMSEAYSKVIIQLLMFLLI